MHVPAGLLVMGIDPQRRRLEVGEYPASTATATYRPHQLCPHHRAGHFTVELFALSREHRVTPAAVNTGTLTDVTLNSLAMGRFTAEGGLR